MKIETHDYFYLSSYQKTFFRVQSLTGENGMEIQPLESSCFWAFVDMDDNDFRIIAFPDRNWFKDWLKVQSNKVRVIQEQGIVGVEK